MKTLLIDNFDSFTYNLYQLIAEVNRVPPEVVSNNAISWEEIKKRGYDNIVISPGPGRPEKESDFGVCREVLMQSQIPVLGVCLGHQGLCHYTGGKVDYADKVMHGRVSVIHHSKGELFQHIPSPFNAVRYHSLVASEVSNALEVTAFSTNNIVMAVRHKSRPMWGVQFHPESICSEYGFQILKNFRDLTVDYHKYHPGLNSGVILEQSLKTEPVNESPAFPATAENPTIFYRRLPFTLNSELAFRELFQESRPAFWLDSSLQTEETRFSFMGDGNGPLSEFISYRALDQSLTVTRGGESTELRDSVFSYLQRQLSRYETFTDNLPFDFNLGYVGYFGYELKAECGYRNEFSSSVPDAQWLLADRVLVFDHDEDVIYLVCLEFRSQQARGKAWLEQMELVLNNLAGQKLDAVHQLAAEEAIDSSIDKYSRALSENEYIAVIERAKEAIREGESYEICLTNQLFKQTDASPFSVYSALRALNPAPYSCFLAFGETHILCSSPERFLTIDQQRMVESKPIKGTRKRGVTALEDEALISDLINNEKDRAENLMIVDLLRNDLGQVCDIGSVQVNKLFNVESYATVHQLVSTVRGHLKRGSSSVDCVKACFPGGSMTGAPKKRTLELLGGMEKCARGIYSGSIGFLAFNGCADLNIVIRTVVIHRGVANIGVGGAIVDLSDPQQELDETLLKSRALIGALLVAEQRETD
ncbi:aminodeoxychorismate synthase component I [Teredinibacter haidensis]|uniref:aminodeoxychorismate synthase component I n=1 Tax=Teredinibacter haidensis TaxID=2731755 RepID=UPI00163D2F0E|nr:aminodeoxychorismate synthase component I [Teredinibacter haidensis]